MAAPQRLAGSERPRSRRAKLLGALGPDEVIGLTLVLRHKPGSPALPDHDHWLNTPPGKRQFLTPQQYAKTYGATQADLDAVTSSVTAQGARVLSTHAGRRNVSIAASVAQLKLLFGVELKRYESPQGRRRRAENATSASPVLTHVHHGHDGPVYLPAELAGIVIAVVGLDNRAVGGCGSSSGDPTGAVPLSVPTVAKAYNFPNPGASDQVIGVIAPSDPAGTSNQRVSGYLSNDISNLYFPNLSDSNYQTAPAFYKDIELTVGTNTYTNSTSTVAGITSANISTDASSFALEVTQDITTALTIAQGAAVNVYFTELTEQGLLVCLNRILFPEAGESQPTVVTCSFNFFGDDSSDSIGSYNDSGSTAFQCSGLFQQLALIGVGVFIIAQDNGSDDGESDGNTHVCYPGSDPWVTCVGGTVLVTNPGPPPTLKEEVVWSNAGSTTHVDKRAGVTGGGASENFPIPAYQSAAGITSITDSQGNHYSKRFIPDVAGMVAYSGSGSQDWFYINGLTFYFSGTSSSCPLFAGLYAVMRSLFGIPLGFFNPTLYQIGSSVCNDVTSGNNDSADGNNAPYFTAGTGWDPCTGWGSIDGTKLLNGLAKVMFNQTFYFQMEKNTYGLDEVSVNLTYSPAFWLVLEGFSYTAAKTLTPSLAGAFSTLAGISIAVSSPIPEIQSQPDTPQRVLFRCAITFPAASAATVADGGYFPALGADPISLPLTAVLTIQGQEFAAATIFELAGGSDPSFANFNSTGTNAFYLSEDLRIFTVTPGINTAPVYGINLLPADNTQFDSGAAYNYIQVLLAVLNASNADATGPDAFGLLPDQSDALTTGSSVTPTSVNPADSTGTPFSNYSFAIARVRLNGPPSTTTSKNVRVFFRLFATETSDTDYVTDWTYPSTLDGTFPRAPLLGSGNPPVTIPFFATGNFENNTDHPANQDYSGTSANNYAVPIPASGQGWAYFGCFLNVYPTANTIGGQSVQSMLPGSHHCLVAQIAYDDAPIINSNGVTENPQNSDKLAQRNLEITLSDNPGPPSTHRIPQTFDIRRGPQLATGSGSLLDYPDELMIDWGNTPVGAVAHIYWPQVSASDVLALAKKLYSTHQLSAGDANTIHCKVPHGFTFVPIPPGTGDNYAGLFTVDLPAGITTGQSFLITVRRVSTRGAKLAVGAPPVILETLPASAQHAASVAVGSRKMTNWRYVAGSFAVRIPVTTAKVMLPLEESTLAIIKWRLTQMAPTNRWYPVMVRYISYLSGRVDGLGGSSGSISPDPYGAPPSKGGHPGKHQREYTGKVMSIIYDRFGDFEGFLVLSEWGHEHRFTAREHAIETLVRQAWERRMVISVIVNRHAEQIPVSIILRRPD